MAENKVVLATEETTVHLKLASEVSKDNFGNEAWAVESKILLPGQFVNSDKLPPYLVEKIEKGEAQGLAFVSQSEAEQIQAAAADEPDGSDVISVQGFPSKTEEKKKKVKAAAAASKSRSEDS